MPDQEAYRDQYERLWRGMWANTHAGGPMARTRYRLARRWLALRPESSERMLDVGAGNGAFMLEVIERSPRLEIYGAEYSQAAIDLAHPGLRKRLARCDLQGDQPLPWGGGFEVITCMEVLEHLPDDERALAHIAHALAPGGRLLVSVPAWQAKWGPQDVAAGHVRRYEPELLTDRMTRAGLTVRRVQCWGGPLAWIYLRAADLIGPEKVMSVEPRGFAGHAAGTIYQLLRLDDALSFGGGRQLLALAVKPQ